MSSVVRVMQWVGIAVLVATAFHPVFHFRAYPVEGLDVPQQGVVLTAAGAVAGAVGIPPYGAREVPAQELQAAVREAVDGPARVSPFWERRRWYPYFLLPLWILALGVAAQGGRWRRMAGAGLWGLTLFLALFEALYLYTEYAPFLQGLWGRLEGFGAWCFVLAILVYRRPADRHLGAVEAAVAAQALLGFVHALTLPSTMARVWLPGFSGEAVWTAVVQNYPAPFWIGCVGLLLVALPVYLRPPVRAATAQR